METIFEISPNATKIDKYKEAIKYIESLVADEKDLYANLANICAILKIYFKDEFSWVGF
ncbi:MAG: hypothetical protein IGBAC_1017 [Ignavibacteriae bacterium]|nr:MAG: hypothetical protein IGBAC_1017 [Ignavibacteriota bacterium]